MRDRTYRDKNGRLARVRPTATGYLIRYRDGRTTSISFRQLALIGGESGTAEMSRARQPSHS